jgi:hypothetical protein
MRALDHAHPFHDGAGQHTRFAKHFQSKARPHDVHDGINCADLVEMDFLRRMAVNLSFRDRHAVKGCNGFLLYPWRQPAALDESANIGECSSMHVRTAVPGMIMILHELNLNPFAPAAVLNPEHRLELMGLGQFLRCFKVLATSLESEKLPPFAVANRFQCHVLLRHRFDAMAVGVEEIKAKPRRHVRLEDAQFNVACLGPGLISLVGHQRAPVRTVDFSL